jgi:tetratricopeptide (TPR) repeat protein
LAGVFLAHSVGSRSAGAPLSGSLPSSTSDRLAQAAQFLSDGKAVEAVKLYDKILKEDPKQPVALAYRGWLVRLAGLKEEGLAYEERAVAADPSYADAHFFRGMMLWEDQKNPAAAVADFRLFLANRPPQAMVALVEDALRRASQEAGIPVDATTTTAR